MKFRVLLFIVGFGLTPWLCCGQVKIHNNSAFKAQGIITTNSTIVNSSPNVDMSNIELKLVNQGNQQANTSSPIVVKTLHVDEGGVKTFSGNWEVLESLALVNGILKIDNAGKLLYTGTQDLEGNENAFIDGFLFRKGNGQLAYPIGSGSIYAPVIIENASGGEYGIRVFQPNTDLIPPANVIGVFTDHQWEINGVLNSPISLSLNNTGDFLDGGVPVVLQAPSSGGTATSLSGAVNSSFVTSIENVTQSVVAIGKAAEFSLVIHDLITPYRPEFNDKLVIENIEKLSNNKVKLLDRWGMLVMEWRNYSNDNDYDFTKLPPGNYVCIVEYTYPGEAKPVIAKGMVTILKSN